jgi:hypothetical protein
VSIWLQSATNEGQFVHAAYCLYAYICVCILLILKITLGRKRDFSFIYEYVEGEIVSEFELHLKEYNEIDKKNLKRITA